MTHGPVRVAVFGAGVMGRHHASNYLALPGAELVGIVDPDPTARRAAEERFGRPTFPDAATMLASIDVDAASIVVPTSLHYELAVRLLDAGLHVLVEKPVTTSVSEAADLAMRSKLVGRVLQVGHITRFYRAVRLLRERVREPYLIEARRLTPSARVKDVGVILDLMIHDIDIVLSLVASEIRDVSVAGHVVHGGRHEDVAAAQITFENGAIARFLASRIAPDAERSLVVAEPDQTFRVDFLREPHTEVSVYRSKRDPSGDTHVRSDRHVVHEDNPLREELEHFLARIADGATPIGTLDDDVRSLRVATSMIDQLTPRLRSSALQSARVHSAP